MRAYSEFEKDRIRSQGCHHEEILAGNGAGARCSRCGLDLFPLPTSYGEAFVPRRVFDAADSPDATTVPCDGCGTDVEFSKLACRGPLAFCPTCLAPSPCLVCGEPGCPGECSDGLDADRLAGAIESAILTLAAVDERFEGVEKLHVERTDSLVGVRMKVLADDRAFEIHVRDLPEKEVPVDPAPVPGPKFERSLGHLGFLDDGKVEVYERNGEVSFAPISNVISTDGYRIGRWECSNAHFRWARKHGCYAGFERR